MGKGAGKQGGGGGGEGRRCSKGREGGQGLRAEEDVPKGQGGGRWRGERGGIVSQPPCLPALLPAQYNRLLIVMA